MLILIIELSQFLEMCNIYSQGWEMRMYYFSDVGFSVHNIQVVEIYLLLACLPHNHDFKTVLFNTSLCNVDLFCYNAVFAATYNIKKLG